MRVLRQLQCAGPVSAADTLCLDCSRRFHADSELSKNVCDNPKLVFIVTCVVDLDSVAEDKWQFPTTFTLFVQTFQSDPSTQRQDGLPQPHQDHEA